MTHAAAACRAFGLGDPDRAGLAPLPGNPLLCVVHGPQGTCLLKRYRLLRPENAPALDRLLAACQEARVIPAHYPATDGSLVVAAGDGLYSLAAREETVPLDPDADLEAAARAVARFHAAAAAVACDRPLLPPLFVAPDRLRRLLAARFPDLLPLLELGEAASRQAPRQLVHNDLHPGNVLRTARGEVLLVDLESFSHNPRVGDACFAAMRLGRLDRARARRFLAAYARALPLDPAESALGPAALLADLVRKVGFILHREDLGDAFFLKDLDNYLGFVEWARELLDAGNAAS